MKAQPQNYEQDELAAQIIKQYQQMSSERGNWEVHWEEIAERVWPSVSRKFNSLSNFRAQGIKLNQELFDSTANIALGRFGAILDSLLTPRNQTWHKLQATDPALNKDRQVRLWFETINSILFKYRYAPRANFASQNQQNYKTLGAFGTGTVFIDGLATERGLRYRAIHLGEIYFRENHQGIVDTAFRYFPMTARQAQQKWGDAVPETTREFLKTNPDRESYYIHCVMPREDQDISRLDYKGMAFVSYYISMEGRKILSESGFSSFPYAISRYEQAPGEVYGRSPAMDVLPSIKTLNEEKKTLLKQGHRIVDPVLLTHDDGIIDGFSLRPGAMNAGGVTKDGRPLVHALPTGRLDIGKEMMDDERKDINDAFLVNLFQILVDTPTMTATEVLERTREKGILLAPTIGRQQSEYLGPMIEREIDLLVRQGLVPQMPPALVEAGTEYRVEYDSPLSRAQRAEEAAGLMRTVELAIKIATEAQDPEPLDWFDWDVILPEVAAIQGVPVKWLKDLKAVQAGRAQRAQAAQTNQMINAAPGAAAMIKSIAVAKKSGGGQPPAPAMPSQAAQAGAPGTPGPSSGGG